MIKLDYHSALVEQDTIIHLEARIADVTKAR